MEEWLHPRAPNKQHPHGGKGQASPQSASGSTASSWNQNNIYVFAALGGPQTEFEDQPQESESLEKESKAGKFVSSAMGQVNFEERAHLGKSGAHFKQ